MAIEKQGRLLKVNSIQSSLRFSHRFFFALTLAFSFIQSGNAEDGKLASDSAIWIDVRSDEEFATGHLEGAIHIPFRKISNSISEVTTNKDTPIFLYCLSGGRADVAKESLEQLGYSNVTNLRTLENARKHAKQYPTP